MASSVFAAHVRVTHLRCEYADQPIGLDVTRPRLFWRLEADRRAEKQTAYQILVATSQAPLRHDEADVWDSGKTVSEQSAQVEYAGPPLRPGTRYWWKVRVWDRDGRAGRYSKPSYWEMGMPAVARQGKWITVPDTDEANESSPPRSFGRASWIWTDEGPGTNAANDAPAGIRYFRRAFTLPENRVPTGTITLTADDHFVLWINGKMVGKSGDGEDTWKQPQTFDLALFLRPGRNVVAIAARNESGPAGMLALLRLRSGAEIVTDTNWKVFPTEQSGWEQPEFDDAAWQSAQTLASVGGGPWGRITPAGKGASGPGRYLRKEFMVAKKVRRARLYASAMGLYEPFLNGKRVGNDVFAPGWTDYRKRVQYQTYDVTDFVQSGSNVLGIILSDGWYAGSVGLVGRGVYGTTPLAWGELKIDYTDGTSETIATDETWRGTTSGPTIGADLLQGETYDARREMPWWNTTHFDDKGWQPARVETITTPLEAQRGPAVRREAELRPHTVTKIKQGVFVFDLGQNMVGWARLRARGLPAGATVTLRFAEMLNPDGTIYTTNYRGAHCTDTYTAGGNGTLIDGLDVYEPHFTFRGFRYVEVTGLKSADLTTITGVVVHSDTPVTGTMETSSPLVNQLLKNIDWGQRGNFLSVPTDCPQRDERLGWMGDAQIFVRTATYNRDVAGFFTKWMVDVDDAQSAGGAFSDVAPRVTSGEGTAAWGDAGVICPWTIYLAYGDKRVLADHFEAMTRWIGYCEKHSTNLLRPASGYGDWLSINADTPTDVLATAYFAYSTQMTAQAARVLGRDADAHKYSVLFHRIKAAFNTAYVTPDGHIKGDTQTGYLLALRFNLLPDALRLLAAKYLAADIVRRDNHLSTGFVGVGYLCPVLSEAGYDELAYKLLEQDTFPSWGYSIRHGATTIWERWDGWTEIKGFQTPSMNSFNHYSFGSIGEWLYAYSAGIELDPADPGYHHSIIRPHPGGGLTFAKATCETLYGPIKSGWTVGKRGLELRVSIPANTTATVYVPVSGSAPVMESGKLASQSSGVRFLQNEAGSAVFEVGSGEYRFQSKEWQAKISPLLTLRAQTVREKRGAALLVPCETVFDRLSRSGRRR